MALPRPVDKGALAAGYLTIMNYLMPLQYNKKGSSTSSSSSSSSAAYSARKKGHGMTLTAAAAAAPAEASFLSPGLHRRRCPILQYITYNAYILFTMIPIL